MAMDAITPEDQISRAEPIERPSMDEAMDAVRTLLAWAGDDPRREEPRLVEEAERREEPRPERVVAVGVARPP